MSEDRLEKALQEMRQEDVDAGTLEAARARVWNEMTNAAGAGCAEFRPDLRAYLTGAIGGSRRVLLEDHLGRCPSCRARWPRRRAKGEWSPCRKGLLPLDAMGALAAAAVLVLSILYLGRDAIDAMMAPGGPRATVVAADGGSTACPGSAQSGASISEKELVRTGPGAHAVLRLADGSMVDVNERTELFVTSAWSGRAIHLQRGDINVQAAKQRRGYLRVLTRDSIASVKEPFSRCPPAWELGGLGRGRVRRGEPARQGSGSQPREQAAQPALASSVQEAVS